MTSYELETLTLHAPEGAKLFTTKDKDLKDMEFFDRLQHIKILKSFITSDKTLKKIYGELLSSVYNKAEIKKYAKIVITEEPTTPTTIVTTTPEVAELKQELEEVKAIQAEIEIEIEKTTAMKIKLDETIKQIEIQKQQDALEQKELERQMQAMEQKIITVEKLYKLEKKYANLTEIRNKLAAQIRKALNLERTFTQYQRTQLLIQAGGRCQLCGDAVTIDTFEADHIIPWSKGGKTILENGQCLCRRCNRAKGAKA